MSWFVVEIGVALAPLGLLLWWTVRSMRRHGAARRDEERPDEGPGR